MEPTERQINILKQAPLFRVRYDEKVEPWAVTVKNTMVCWWKEVEELQQLGLLNPRNVYEADLTQEGRMYTYDKSKTN